MHRRLLLLVIALSAACSSRSVEGGRVDGVIGGNATTEYPDVAHVTSGCTATLIHPRALLTASHCCQSASACKKVVLGDRQIETRPIVHPSFFIAPDGGIQPSWDVTVLVMAEPVTDIAPRRLATSAPAVGREIRFVGFGCNAFGGAGYGTKRTGTNQIAFFGADESGGDTVRFGDVFGWHSYAVDGGTANDDANICPGDSGGPTLWEENGELVLAGVHSLVGPHTGYSCEVAARAEWIHEQLRALDADAATDSMP